MDDNDTSWPSKEPKKWRACDLTRDAAPALADLICEPGFEALENALDEAQGDAQNSEAFLLIRIVDR